MNLKINTIPRSYLPRTPFNCDIELLCDRVIVLDAGKILFDGSLEKVRHMFGDKRNVTIQTPAPIDVSAVVDKYEIENVSTDGDGLLTTFTIDAQKLKIDVLLDVLLKSYKVVDIKLSETGIEQVVEKIYADVKSDDDAAIEAEGGAQA